MTSTATFIQRLSALLDRLTVALYHPHRPPFQSYYLTGSYDLTTKVIPGHELIRVLREQQPAPRARRLSA
jgi:hypothetical protein